MDYYHYYKVLSQLSTIQAILSQHLYNVVPVEINYLTTIVQKCKLVYFLFVWNRCIKDALHLWTHPDRMQNWHTPTPPPHLLCPLMRRVSVIRLPSCSFPHHQRVLECWPVVGAWRRRFLRLLAVGLSRLRVWRCPHSTCGRSPRRWCTCLRRWGRCRLRRPRRDGRHGRVRWTAVPVRRVRSGRCGQTGLRRHRGSSVDCRNGLRVRWVCCSIPVLSVCPPSSAVPIRQASARISRDNYPPTTASVCPSIAWSRHSVSALSQTAFGRARCSIVPRRSCSSVQTPPLWRHGMAPCRPASAWQTARRVRHWLPMWQSVLLSPPPAPPPAVSSAVSGYTASRHTAAWPVPGRLGWWQKQW